MAVQDLVALFDSGDLGDISGEDPTIAFAHVEKILNALLVMNGVSNYDKQTVFGDEATAAASRLHQRYNQQHKSAGRKKEIRTIQTVDALMSLNWQERHLYPYEYRIRNTSSGEWEGRTVNVPITIRESIIVTHDQKGNYVLMIDHAGGLVPDSETYQAIAQEQLDAERFFRKITYDLFIATDTDEFREIINSNAQSAQQAGLEFNGEKIAKQLLNYGGNPMHCYVAGVASPVLLELGLLYIFKRQVNESDPRYASIDIWDEIVSHLDDDSLDQMRWIDVSPVPWMNRIGFLMGVSRQLFNSTEHKVSSGALFEFGMNVAADYMGEGRVGDYWASAALSPRIRAGAIGLLYYHTKFGYRDRDHLRAQMKDGQGTMNWLQPNECAMIERAWQMQTYFDGIQLSEIGSAESIVDRRAADLLHLDAVNAARVVGTHDSFRAQDVRGFCTGHQLGSLHHPAVEARLEAPFGQSGILKAPQMRVEDVNRSYWSTRAYMTPAWNALLYRHSYPVHDSLDGMQIGMRTLLEFLTNPDIQRQCDARTYEAVLISCLELQKVLEEKREVDTEADVSSFRQEEWLEEIFYEFADRITQNKPLEAAWEYLVGSVLFYIGIDRQYALMHLAGFREMRQWEPFDGKPAVKAERLFPFQLLVKQAEKSAKVVGEISRFHRYSDLTTDQYSLERLGKAIPVVIQAVEQGDEIISCRVRYYDADGNWINGAGERDWERWQVSVESSKIIREVFGSLPHNDQISHAKVIVNYVERVVDEWLQNSEDEQLFERARATAIAFEGLANLDSVGGKRDALFLHITGHLGEFASMGFWFRVLDRHLKSKIVPYEKLEVSYGRPAVILGPNGAGKSTLMRAIAFLPLLSAQHLPTPGEATAPPMLVESPVGKESIGLEGSLFTATVRGLNAMLRGAPETHSIGRMGTMRIIDEIGRRTNKVYGEALVLACLIANYLQGEEDNPTMSIMASHYHSLPRYVDLLQELGLDPIFWVMDQDHSVHRLQPGETTTSDAYHEIMRQLPQEVCLLWPGRDPEEVVDPSERIEGTKPGVEEIHEFTKSSLLGKGKTCRENIGRMMGIQNEAATEAVDHYLLNQNNGEDFAAVAERVIAFGKEASLASDCACLDRVLRYNKLLHTRTKDLFTYTEARYGFFGIRLPDERTPAAEYKLMFEQARESLANAEQQLKDDYQLVVSAMAQFTQIPDLFGGELDFGNLQTADVFIQDKKWAKQTANLLAFLGVCQHIADQGMRSVVFTDGSVLKGKECRNPELCVSMGNRRDQVVGNDFEYDFVESSQGALITGENHSGKTNHLHGEQGWNIFLGQCWGYAQGDLTIPRNLLLAMMTQPVSDDSGLGSMGVEVRDRLAPAIAAMSQKDRNVLVLIDEPAAPTSPEEATQVIRWLYRIAELNSRVRLSVTTQCDDLPPLLEQDGITVEYQCFRFLEESYHKKSGTSDCRALDVAERFGLHPYLLTLARILVDYIREKALLPAGQEMAAERLADYVTFIHQGTEGIPDHIMRAWQESLQNQNPHW